MKKALELLFAFILLYLSGYSQNDIKQIPWKPGKKIILQMMHNGFEVIMPDGLQFIGPKALNASLSPMFRKNESMSQVVLTNIKPTSSFSIREYWADSAKNGNNTVPDCEKDIKNIEQYNAKMATLPGVSSVFKYKDVQVRPIGNGFSACLTTQITQQMDTKKWMFGFQMTFEYKNSPGEPMSGYLLTGIAPLEWKDCMMEMLKSFHATNAKAVSEPDKSCSGSDILELPELAFEDNWMVPDPKGKLKITISPNLPRNAVPYAWHDIISITRELVSKIEELNDHFEEKEEGGVLKDVFEFAVDYLEVPQITPGQLADAYLNVMDKMITAVAGLEGKISNMYVDFSYELPYINVKTKCIPRFKCVNGKWQRDISDMSFQKISETRLKESHTWNHQTPGQLSGKEAEVEKIPVQLKENADKVNKQECGQHRYKLLDLNWPPDPKKCEQLEKSLALLREQLKAYQAEKQQLAKELKEYGDSKFKNIDKTKALIAAKNAELKLVQQKLATAMAKKKGYEANQSQMAPELFEKLMKEVNQEIVNLNLSVRNVHLDIASLNERLKILQSDQFEQINYKRTQFVNGEITRLNSEIAYIEKELEACRKK